MLFFITKILKFFLPWQTLRPKTISITKALEKTTSFDYQIIQVMRYEIWQKDHVLYATHLTPLNFLSQYKKVLNKKKKIVIFGPWRKNTRFYRFLEREGYNVFLTIDKKEESSAKSK